MLRLPLCIVFTLLLTGCWPDARPPSAPTVRTPGPTADVIVFNDGFHSGFIVPLDILPFELKSRQDSIAQLPEEMRALHRTIGAPATHAEIGFSDELWVTGEDRSRAYAVYRLFVPGDGVLFIQKMHDATRNRSYLPARIVIPLRLDPDATLLFQQALLEWIDFDRSAWEAIHEPEQFLIPTKYRYGLLWNCHDWTAHILRRIGFPIEHTAWRTPGIMDDQLRRSAQLLKAKGVEILGPGAISAVELP